MNTEPSEAIINHNINTLTEQSTTQQLRITAVESTATNPVRQSLDYSHQVIGHLNEKNLLPPNHKSQSDAVMRLYIGDILETPKQRNNMKGIEEEIEIENKKGPEQTESPIPKENKSSIIELPDLNFEVKRSSSHGSQIADEADHLKETTRNQEVAQTIVPIPIEQPAMLNVHEMWIDIRDLHSNRAEPSENGPSRVTSRRSTRQISRNNSRRITNRLRHQNLNGNGDHTTVLGQMESMNYEAWVDFDAIQAQENRELHQRVTQQIDSKYYSKVGVFIIEFILFVVTYLVAIDLFGLQVFTAVLAIMFGGGAVYLGAKLTRDDFQDRELRWKVLVFFDWLCFIQFFLCLTLKIQGNLKSSLFFNAIPGFFLIVLYLTAVELPRSQKAAIIVLRVLFWAQLLLLSLKIDDYVDIGWNLTFVVCWFVFIALVVAAIINLGFLGINVYLYVKGRRPASSMPMKWQVLSLSIHFAMLLVSGFALTILISFTKYMDGSLEHLDILEAAALGGLIYAVFALTLAVIFRMKIRGLFQYEVTSNPNNRAPPGQRVIAFKTTELKGAPEFYAMISPSYFVLFDMSLMVNEDEQVIKLRKYMINLKDKAKAAFAKKKTSNTKIPIEKLKQEIKTKKGYKSLNLKQGDDKKEISLQVVKEVEYQDIENMQAETKELKLSLSVDDRERINEFKKDRNAALNIEDCEEGEQLCFICYERTANSIFMSCGHGGICFECAQETWNKKSACTSCRERITEIVKFVPVKGMRMVKAVSKTKKVYEVLRSRSFAPASP